MTSVLVTDGGQRAALAVVRSLGAAGLDVHVCASATPSLAGGSRYSALEAEVPDPLAHPDGFTESVRRLVERHGIDVLLPVTDASLTPILQRRDFFANTLLPFPDFADYSAISDKGRVVQAAADVGIRVPRQRVLRDRTDDRSGAGESVGLPLVVKPTRSVVRAGLELKKTGVAYADSECALDRVLDDLPDAAFPVLLQERVCGRGIGVFLLRWDGEVLAAFAHRRIREKPPSGGVSVLRESVPLPPELLRRSTALLERFDWRGVAMIEYKGESPEASPVLMEVNGRFWGSLQLAIDAGVDFPRLLVAAARGMPQPPVTEYRHGVRCRWFWGDVDHLITRLRRSRRQLSLDDSAPGRLKAAASFIASSLGGARGEVLRWDDPKPALRESIDWVRRR